MTEGWLICGKLWERGRKPPFHFIGWDYFFKAVCEYCEKCVEKA